MKNLSFTLALLASLPLTAWGNGASSPDALVIQLQRALDSGDTVAAGELLDLPNAPAELRFLFLGSVRECASEMKCTTAKGPMTEADHKEFVESARVQDLSVPAIEGLVTVEQKSKDGSGSGTMKMPYAKIDGSYRLVSQYRSPEQLARVRAKTNEALLQELFAGGIYDDATREHRKDWATIATPLPAGGGAPGAALVKQTDAMAAAVDAKDPDAAMRSGDPLAQILYADKDYAGKPVPFDARQRKLALQALRMLRDVKVGGGYAYGRDAALTIDARNGTGWIERGAVLLTRDGDDWSISGRKTVSYPDDAGATK